MSEHVAPLTVVYGPFKSGGKMNGQELMSIFNERGLVDEAHLEQVYKELIGHEAEMLKEGAIGPFDDLEQIQKFCFNLCQIFGNSGVSLVSLDKYNEILTGSFKVEDLRNRLEREGSFIKNPDAQKGGFFNKIFS